MDLDAEDVKFQDCLILGGDFLSSIFRNCIFMNVVFRESYIEGTNFDNCVFDNCKFSNVESDFSMDNCDTKKLIVTTESFELATKNFKL